MWNFDEIKKYVQGRENGPLDHYRHYAVFLPLVEVDGELSFLYQVRSMDISNPGDTAFPGGRVEPSERFQDAAVREMIEELQVSEEQIEVYGELDYVILGNRLIGAFIGRLKIDDISEITPNEEVDHVFTVPLSELVNHPPETYRSDVHVEHPIDFPYDRINKGKKYPFMKIQEETIFYNLDNGEELWGLTAKITRNFIDELTEKGTD